MKTKLSILLIMVLLVSCKPDNKTKLEKLKQQQEAIMLEIQELEKLVGQEEGKSVAKEAIVVVADVVPAPFDHFIDVQGKVDGEENVAVGPRMMGVVTDIYVREGEEVKRGQLLAQLDDAIYRQSLAALDSTRVFLNNMFIKQKNLWEQNIGSEVQYLLAKNNLESIDNNIKSLKEQLKTMSITSPINGTIEELNIKIGQTVSPGITTAFRVVNLAKLKVVAEVAESYASKIKTGSPVLLHFPDLMLDIKSRISFSSRYINPINRTFICEVNVDASDEIFRANMIAVMKINDYHNDFAITVPVNLVQKIDDVSYIYTAQQENGHYVARKTKVTTGYTYNGTTEIKEGLKADDKIITVGYQSVEDGTVLKF